MATSGGPNITTEGLVFGYDTGYPLVSGSHETYRFNKGEPTTTFDIGTMVPTNPNTFFTSSDTYHYNMHGTVWDWTYYPNSNVSTDGGMEWIPNYEGPGFIGAWKMKKRSGGNSESNFSGTAPGSIDADKDYTVSVWCKTSNHSMARIHLNTTKDGSSYWGYASGYHSGNGTWERLSVTIPSGSLNTSLNTIRCQCLGTSTDADAYWRDYQVEQRDHATPFILGGTRSVSGSLIDLTRTTDIDLSLISFDKENAQITFDGTDDYFTTTGLSIGAPTSVSFETVIRFDGTLDSNDRKVFHWDKTSTTNGVAQIRKGNANGRLMYQHHDGSQWYTLSVDDVVTSDTYIHILVVHSSTTATMYKDGVQVGTATVGNLEYTNAGEILVGYRANSEYWKGDIPIFKVYNRALAAEEVKENYNAIKSRFGLT
jgi:hypothetical protein